MRWSFKRGLAALIVLMSLSVSTADAGEITVSAAMSLKDAFTEMADAFEQSHPGAKVVLNFGASGVLRGQIEGGAPVDVFASASSREMDVLDAGGMIIRDTRVDFAGNTIVLIGPSDTRLRSFDDLMDSEVRRVVVGNPATTPFGMYSREVLISLALWDAVENKLVLAEHVRQALDYVARAEVDAGMVYRTDVRVRVGEERVISEAPAGSHGPVVYPIAVVEGARDRKLAGEFVSHVLSEEGRDVLRGYGFKVDQQPGQPAEDVRWISPY